MSHNGIDEIKTVTRSGRGEEKEIRRVTWSFCESMKLEKATRKCAAIKAIGKQNS